MKAKNLTTQVNIRLAPEELDALRRLAYANGERVSHLLRRSVWDLLEQETSEEGQPLNRKLGNLANELAEQRSRIDKLAKSYSLEASTSKEMLRLLREHGESIKQNRDSIERLSSIVERLIDYIGGEYGNKQG